MVARDDGRFVVGIEMLARTSGRYEVVKPVRERELSGAELRAHEKRERKAAKKRRDLERARHGKPEKIAGLTMSTVNTTAIVPDVERCSPQCDCGRLLGVTSAEITLINDNDDRTRALVRCRSCDREWYACRAKRLAEQPDESGNREAWGPVGVWGFNEKVRA